jgi:hypothetical protein
MLNLSMCQSRRHQFDDLFPISIFNKNIIFSSKLSTAGRIDPWKKTSNFKLLKPNIYLLHQHFNIQQLYALPTLYLCVLYLSENKQRLVPLTALTDWFL